MTIAILVLSGFFGFLLGVLDVNDNRALVIGAVYIASLYYVDYKARK